MKAKTTIGIFDAALLLAASGWYAYAITYPAKTLANQGRCEESIRIKLVNTTRRLFGAKTSSQINADITQQYRDRGLAEPASRACAD